MNVMIEDAAVPESYRGRGIKSLRSAERLPYGAFVYSVALKIGVGVWVGEQRH